MRPIAVLFAIALSALLGFNWSSRAAAAPPLAEPVNTDTLWGSTQEWVPAHYVEELSANAEVSRHGLEWLPEFRDAMRVPAQFGSHSLTFSDSLETISRSMPGELQLASLHKLQSWVAWVRYLSSLDVLAVEERLAILECFRGAGFDNRVERGLSRNDVLAELSGTDWYYKLATELATSTLDGNSFNVERFLGVVRRHVGQERNPGRRF